MHQLVMTEMKQPLSVKRISIPNSHVSIHLGKNSSSNRTSYEKAVVTRGYWSKTTLPRLTMPQEISTCQDSAYLPRATL